MVGGDGDANYINKNATANVRASPAVGTPKNTTEPKKLVSWGSSGEIWGHEEGIFPVTPHPKQKFVRRMIKWAKKKDMW